MTIVYNPIKNMILNLESFASNINHEFKTSISEILSSLELAKLTKEFEEANEFAIKSTKRLNNILDVLGIFIYFTNSDYRKQKIDIVSLLDHDILEFRSKINEKNIKIIKLYNTKHSIFKIIDKEPLILCFRNILKNAIRYSHPN
jgi:signal transduction histidine kinase